MRHAVSGYAVFGLTPVDAAEIGFRYVWARIKADFDTVSTADGGIA